MRLSLIISAMSVVFVWVVLSPTNCADLGVSEPVVTVVLTQVEPYAEVRPYTTDTYEIFQSTQYSFNVSTDNSSDFIADPVFIGDGPEINTIGGWFKYVFSSPTDAGLKTVVIDVTRDGRTFTKTLTLNVLPCLP